MASYIDDLQFPQVLNTLQCAVAAGKKVGQIFMQTKAIQPSGKRCAAITPQCFYLRRQMHLSKQEL